MNWTTMDQTIVENQKALVASKASELHSKRARLDEEKLYLKALLEDPEILDAQEIVSECKQQVSTLENEVREGMLRVYALTGQKKNLGLEVIERQGIRILDYQAALNWCIEHMHSLLVLDEEKLKDYLVKVGDEQLSEFVEVTSTPTAKLPSNLDKALKEMEAWLQT